MAVFRIEKTRDYTVMANHHLRNTALSLKAKGLLSLMLSLPEDWDYTTKGLARICRDGVDSICATVRELEDAGADAVGFNCVAADMMTPCLVSKLRRYTSLPLICKPNAGIPTINQAGVAEYNLSRDAFAKIMKQCADNGALLLGGCCGTTPEYIAAVKQTIHP